MPVLLSLMLAADLPVDVLDAGEGTANIPPPGCPAPTDEVEVQDRTAGLASILRCPMCEGSSIANSPTEAAAAATTLIEDMIRDGRCDEQIVDEFVSRYGEWVVMDSPDAPLVVEKGFISHTLDNGLHVSILSDPELAIVATQVWVQVGSAHETDNEAGFAHLFEHLMCGATSSHGKEDYARHHTVNGGYENAYTMFDNTVYISNISADAHDEVLHYESDRLTNLVLSQDNLDNEIKIVTEELRLRTENNPFARLLGPALAGLFGDHPYGHSPAGTKEDLANADLELVQKFYAGYYRPENVHLVIVGPVHGPSTLAKVEAAFGPIEGDALTPPEVPTLRDIEYTDRVELTEDIPPIKVAGLYYPGPTKRSEDWYAWELMTEMLAGGELDHFREELVGRRGKAMEAVTITEELEAGAILAFGSVSLPFRRKAKAIKLLHESVEALGEGEWLGEASLETARRRLLRAELERSYYAERLADDVGMAYAWQGDDTLAVDGATEALQAVTLEQVKAVWSTYVAEATPVEVFIQKGDAAEVE